jgi:hypothetical protein
LTLLLAELVGRPYLDLIFLVEIHGLGGSFAYLVVPHGRRLVFRGPILVVLDLVHHLVEGLFLFQKPGDTVKEVLFQGLLSRNRRHLLSGLSDNLLLNAGLLSHLLEVVLYVRGLHCNCWVDLIRHRQLSQASRIWLLEHSLVLDQERSPWPLLGLVLALYLVHLRHRVCREQLQLG